MRSRRLGLVAVAVSVGCQAAPPHTGTSGSRTAPAVEPPASLPTNRLHPGPCLKTEDDEGDGTIEARVRSYYEGDLLIREEIDVQDLCAVEGGYPGCMHRARAADGVIDRIVTYEYDDRGRLTAIIEDANADGSYFVHTRFEYDAAGRRRRKIWQNIQTDFVYEGDRLVREVVSIADEQSPRVFEVTRHTYDAQGRRVRTAQDVPEQPERRVTTYQHDAEGRLVRETVTDNAFATPAVRETSFEHDAQGRVVREVGKTLVEVEYDRAGNPIARTERRGDGDIIVVVRWDYACWRP
jgi:YD repeat-containing protein